MIALGLSILSFLIAAKAWIRATNQRRIIGELEEALAAVQYDFLDRTKQIQTTLDIVNNTKTNATDSNMLARRITNVETSLSAVISRSSVPGAGGTSPRYQQGGSNGNQEGGWGGA